MLHQPAFMLISIRLLCHHYPSDLHRWLQHFILNPLLKCSPEGLGFCFKRRQTDYPFYAAIAIICSTRSLESGSTHRLYLGFPMNSTAYQSHSPAHHLVITSSALNTYQFNLFITSANISKPIFPFNMFSPCFCPLSTVFGIMCLAFELCPVHLTSSFA